MIDKNIFIFCFLLVHIYPLTSAEVSIEGLTKVCNLVNELLSLQNKPTRNCELVVNQIISQVEKDKSTQSINPKKLSPLTVGSGNRGRIGSGSGNGIGSGKGKSVGSGNNGRIGSGTGSGVGSGSGKSIGSGHGNVVGSGGLD